MARGVSRTGAGARIGIATRREAEIHGRWTGDCRVSHAGVGHLRFVRLNRIILGVML